MMRPPIFFLASSEMVASLNTNTEMHMIWFWRQTSCRCCPLAKRFVNHDKPGCLERPSFHNKCFQNAVSWKLRYYRQHLLRNTNFFRSLFRKPIQTKFIFMACFFREQWTVHLTGCTFSLWPYLLERLMVLSCSERFLIDLISLFLIYLCCWKLTSGIGNVCHDSKIMECSFPSVQEVFRYPKPILFAFHEF